MSATSIADTYDPALVTLSVAVAVAASFVSLDVAARIWLSTGRARTGWTIAAATAMGGGIWSMHFIGMVAMSLPVPVRYDAGLTVVSFLIAVTVTGLGFRIVAGRVATPARGRLRLAVAGCLMGLGIAAMHYTGMAALRVPVSITYVPGLVALSVAIACLAATAALWIARREAGVAWRIGAALVMGAAVSGMHYTGMAAACFGGPSSLFHPGAAEIERSGLALIVALGTILILSVEFASAVLDRKMAAFRLREAEIRLAAARRFERLMQSSNDVIVVVDREGRIASTVATGASSTVDLAAGASIFGRVSGAGLQALHHAVRVPRPDGEPVQVEGLRIGGIDGNVRIYEAEVCDLLDEPSVGGIVLTLRDMTAHERATAELVKAKRLAETTSRMKSEFIANMNHELRTPLNAILGFSEMIMMDTDGQMPAGLYREYASDIHASGQALLAIVNDVLDFAKADAGRLQLVEAPFDVEAMAADCLRTVAPAAARRGISLECDVPPRARSLLGDERRLGQVVLNLLSNAVKFSGKGGRVTLRAARLGNADLEISVADTGVGIPPDHLSRVFEPFVQVDGSLARQQEGTGLGLPIARALVELHGGTIGIESEPGAGTTVRVRLPAWRAEAVETTSQPASAQPSDAQPSGSRAPESSRAFLTR